MGHRAAARVALTALVALVAAPAAAEEWQDATDYTKLKSALGQMMKTGAGVSVAQVEAYGLSPPNPPNSYFIDLLNGEFAGLSPHDGSGGQAAGASGHSTAVGQRFYGDFSSAAPGVTDVTIYYANEWMQNDLNVGDPSKEPVDLGYDVQNHSWIGTFAPGSMPPAYAEHPTNVDALRRFDYLLDTANNGAGMIGVVGLSNETTQMPYLLAHSYNAISVGRTDGGHSIGLTLASDGIGTDDTYGPGRAKPDIVAPRPNPTINNRSSWSAAMVSSAAALMYEATANTPAARNEVIKAMIMAGATKNEFPGWTRMPNGPTDYSHPLDDTYGAGELNVYNTFLTNLGGRTLGVEGVPAATATSYGWDYQDFRNNSSAGDISYKFQVPVGSKAPEFSIVLTWNLKITDTDAGTGFAPSVPPLQNLDLQLFNSSGTMIDQSSSLVDNVEHIYRTNLSAGDYTLKVVGAAGWDYGLAWRMATQFNTFSGDFDQNGFIDGIDFLTWQRNFGRLLGATRADGDYNGDGDVDYDDLAGFSPSQLPGSLAQYAMSAGGTGAIIAEPSSLAAALVAAGALTFIGRNSSRLRRA